MTSSNVGDVDMKNRISVSAATVVAALVCSAAVIPLEGAVTVSTGSVVESGSGVASAECIVKEGLGNLLVEFTKNWTPEEIRATGMLCRKHGMKFRLDELFDRRTGQVKTIYAPQLEEILAAVDEYRDVYAGAGLFYEAGGVLYYWQHPAVATAKVKIPPVKTFAEAEACVAAELRRGIALAEKTGVPRPYVNIEASFGFASHLLKAGYDEVDLEVIYGPDQERCYAGVKTAAEVFGSGRFGVDMAMAWYGGVQHDALWNSRWLVSLKHAFMRGANPIYLEHGLLDFKSHGLSCGPDHPYTRAMRSGLAEIARYARENPRPDGLPLAAVAVVQGRNDGCVGGFQTHLYGQRTDGKFLLTDVDRGWELYDEMYRRRTWHNRDAWGNSDYSGNPPFGTVDILPYDAPDSAWARYKTIVFLARNTMDDVLYSRLVRYVKNGGVLVMAASHFDVADRPRSPFVPYNAGDWTELCGVRVKPEEKWRLPHGIKFCANPAPGWRFDPLTPAWDPLYPDGGFYVPALEREGALPFAVASDRFADKSLESLPPVAFYNRLGKGVTVLLASLDPPAARGVRRLYSHIIDQAVAATDVWPKVECSDRVRYSVYSDGTIYILNTEANLRNEVIVRRSQNAYVEKFILEPGELKCIQPAGKGKK